MERIETYGSMKARNIHFHTIIERFSVSPASRFRSPSGLLHNSPLKIERVSLGPNPGKSKREATQKTTRSCVAKEGTVAKKRVRWRIPLRILCVKKHREQNEASDRACGPQRTGGTSWMTRK